jgi:hypothetical protein
MFKFYYLFFIAALISGGCKTAHKAFEKGNYVNAIELGIKRLLKNPNDSESKALLQDAYRRAIEAGEANIRTLSNSTSEPEYEKIYNEYRALQQLYVLIQKETILRGIVQPVNYTNYLETYKAKSGEANYQKGLTLMDKRDKASYREAYRYFQKALLFIPNDSIVKKKDEAYREAIVRIVVLPMGNNNYGYQHSSSSFHLRNFEQNLVRNLQFSQNNEFIKFYSDWDARAEDIDADEVLEMYLNRLEIGRPYDQHSTRNVSKEIVVKETVYKPDSVVKQYARVSAQLIVTRRTLVSEGDLYINVRDMGGRILWSDMVRGEHRWQTEFASYRGDDRALSESDRALINSYNNVTPREDEVMEALLRQIENEMQYRLKSYLNRYY